jgi:hypothetical protein
VRGRPREREGVPVGRKREVAHPPLERLPTHRTALEVLVERLGEPPFEQRLLPRCVLAEDPLALAAIQR